MHSLFSDDDYVDWPPKPKQGAGPNQGAGPQQGAGPNQDSKPTQPAKEKKKPAKRNGPSARASQETARVEMRTEFEVTYREELHEAVELPSATEEVAGPPVLSVSQLTEQIKVILEDCFPMVWVVGEISNFSRPQSGHCYLTLKDERAQIRAVMWRQAAGRVRFDLADGMHVLCCGSLDVYGPRGSYQLVIQEIQPLGIGALELALRQLRDKLAAEGLFDPARKRPLPTFPRRIAVITSPTGAAIRDFLQVMSRRWRGTDVLVVPVRVQGEGAGAEIAAAIEQVNRMAVEIDCLVVTRGGGSLEDLWAFNEEVLVRAIYASRIPVVSAVGHEIDVTLSDLVADVRALTPSEAAERLVPAEEEVRQLIGQHRARLQAALKNQAARVRARLEAIAARRGFRRPLDRVQELARRLDEWSARAQRVLRHRLEIGRHQVEQYAGRLEALSPLSVLSRGYSITQRGDEVVRSAAELAVGDAIRTRYHRGTTVSRVEEVFNDDRPDRPK
jgi:exodeoxyribonuclease VII large subunit